MKPTPKIRGYTATTKNKIVLLYRRSRKVTYLVALTYTKQKASVKIGSRFYGRLYPNRCDLSADGTYFLYFAMGGAQKQYEKPLYCWTAVCMPPSISANALFAHGDTWGGGGRFVDDKTLFIAPGMYPDFDTAKQYTFDKYAITFNGDYGDQGWSSGKGWLLVEDQEKPPAKNSLTAAKRWTKTRGKTILIKSLNVGSSTTSRDRQQIGEYDLHRYDIQREHIKAKTIEACQPTAHKCSAQTWQWADFDNFGRVVAASGSNIAIYKNHKSVLNNSPIQTFDLEVLIDSPEAQP